MSGTVTLAQIEKIINECLSEHCVADNQKPYCNFACNTRAIKNPDKKTADDCRKCLMKEFKKVAK